MFKNRLLKVYKHLKKQAQNFEVGCYRIYDHDLPEFPFCIEIYDTRVYVAEYKKYHSLSEEEYNEWLENSLNIVSEVIGINAENIYLKLRQRKPGRLGQYQKLETQKQEFVVTENGVNFIVNLSDYLDTGLFLDHRTTRKLVMDDAKGKAVLNLFAYTGSFSVYAAAGGAARIDTVDLSNTYINWSKKNFEINSFDALLSINYKFIPADVLEFLQVAEEETYDIIVLDPPTFSNSKKMKTVFDIQQAHVGIINRCLQLLTLGGYIYFSTNSRRFILEKEKINSSKIIDITKATTPFDFAGKINRVCFKIEK